MAAGRLSPGEVLEGTTGIYVSRLETASVDPMSGTAVLRVTDAQGNVVWEPTYERDRVLPPEVAEQVTFALNGVVRNGTGKGAWFGEPVAGKTGTVQVVSHTAYQDTSTLPWEQRNHA